MIYKKFHKRSATEFYYVRFDLQDGRRKKEKAGTTLNQARRLLKKRLGEVTAGTYTDPKKAVDTFGIFLDRFLTDYGAERRSNYYTDRAVVLRAYFGDRQLAALRSVDFDAFARARREGGIEGFRPAGPSTIRKDLMVMGTMFRMARRWGVLELNPAADLDKPSEPKPAGRPLKPEEYHRLRDAAPPWLRPMLRLMVVTGLEPMDLTNLRWDDIDWEGQAIHLARSKSEEPLALPIGEVAREVLEGAGTRFRGGYVFTDSSGGSYASERSRNQISKSVVALLVRLGIRHRGDDRRLEKGHSLKSLRRSTASWATAAGFRGQVPCLLGHSRGRNVTARYIALDADELRPMIHHLDAVEQGRVPQSVPQGENSVGEGLDEAPKAKPSKG